MMMVTVANIPWVLIMPQILPNPLRGLTVYASLQTYVEMTIIVPIYGWGNGGTAWVCDEAYRLGLCINWRQLNGAWRCGRGRRKGCQTIFLGVQSSRPQTWKPPWTRVSASSPVTLVISLPSGPSRSSSSASHPCPARGLSALLHWLPNW